jgi:hypothetical protein
MLGRLLGGKVLTGCIASTSAPIRYSVCFGPGTLDTSVWPIGGSLSLRFSVSTTCATRAVMPVYDSIASGATLSLIVLFPRSFRLRGAGSPASGW